MRLQNESFLPFLENSLSHKKAKLPKQPTQSQPLILGGDDFGLKDEFGHG